MADERLALCLDLRLRVGDAARWPHPFINLRVLGNRTIGASCALMTVLGAVSLGSTYVIPLYCAQIQGYNAEQIGYVVMWSRLPQLVLFPAMPFLMRRIDLRILVPSTHLSGLLHRANAPRLWRLSQRGRADRR